MIKQLMARVMLSTALAGLFATAHAAQHARTKAPPPQPRSTSHACAHPYPRHSTNSKNHFDRRSGEGLRETRRRRLQEDRRVLKAMLAS